MVSAIQWQNELLDHILASEGLMPRLGQLRQVPSVTITTKIRRHWSGPIRP